LIRYLITGQSNRSEAVVSVVQPFAIGRFSRFWLLLPALVVVGSIFTSPALATDRVSVAPGANGPVLAISGPDANATRYLGGDFTAFDAIGTGGGALVDAATASVNRSFPRVLGGDVSASVADGLGGFYIGGDFTLVDGVERKLANKLEHAGYVVLSSHEHATKRAKANSARPRSR